MSVNFTLSCPRQPLNKIFLILFKANNNAGLLVAIHTPPTDTAPHNPIRVGDFDILNPEEYQHVL
jgi:hypothetical protein